MKTNVNPKFIAMMAACALAAGAGNARAQGMPEAAQQLVQTMRPMETPRTAPRTDAKTDDATADEHAYGGAKAGTSASAGGRNADACSGQPRCEVFFGH
ncbi:hypothetical protein P9239_22690 [Caballeronia sp. LZ062]|uniref:hypothetical protein n=1 Tax=unclassified Caballeronia TaxID=2646786 RepID=UPI002859404E|nr:MULTISPECIES: hypothetical protein [unclassified Caballeronia]MDR5856493.1 hypothetical protein [Caballeronia sp. LZ050]MDR5873163.1 hypothetical protein [Caballeronia sp. LZ062]